MRMLVTRGTLFLLGGFVILHLFAFIARTVAPDGTSAFLRIDEENINRVLADAPFVEAIVLGNSHGDDIDFTAMAYDGYQLSRAWGDLFEMQVYLEYLVPRLPRLQVVFIPVSYFTFYWDNGAAAKLAIRRQNMYSVIPVWRPVDVPDARNFITGRGNELVPITAVLREDNWRGVFYGLLRRQNFRPEAVVENPCQHLSVAALQEQAALRARDQIALAQEIERNHQDVQADAYDTAVSIVQYLRQHNIRVVFFTPPYSEAYTAYYQAHDPAAIVLWQDTMQRLQEEMDVEYYNFATDETFATDYQLFKDADHLNRCGAATFSQALNQAINWTLLQRPAEN